MYAITLRLHRQCEIIYDDTRQHLILHRFVLIVPVADAYWCFSRCFFFLKAQNCSLAVSGKSCFHHILTPDAEGSVLTYLKRAYVKAWAAISQGPMHLWAAVGHKNTEELRKCMEGELLAIWGWWMLVGINDWKLIITQWYVRASVVFSPVPLSCGYISSNQFKHQPILIKLARSDRKFNRIGRGLTLF